MELEPNLVGLSHAHIRQNLYLRLPAWRSKLLKHSKIGAFALATFVSLVAFSPLRAQDPQPKPQKQDAKDKPKPAGSTESGTQPPSGYRIGAEDELAIAV